MTYLNAYEKTYSNLPSVWWYMLKLGKIYDHALQHAWKVFNFLPVRVIKVDGHPSIPFKNIYLRKFMSVQVQSSLLSSCSEHWWQERIHQPLQSLGNTEKVGVKAIHVEICIWSEGWLSVCYSQNQEFSGCSDLVQKEHHHPQCSIFWYWRFFCANLGHIRHYLGL